MIACIPTCSLNMFLAIFSAGEMLIIFVQLMMLASKNKHKNKKEIKE